MNKNISFSQPYVDLGDNQFLEHHTLEIFIDNKFSGHAMITLYDYERAEQLFCSASWISKAGSYLSSLSSSLLRPDSYVARIPFDLPDDLSGPGVALIIDEVVLSTPFTHFYLEQAVTDLILSEYSSQSSFSVITKKPSPKRAARYSVFDSPSSDPSSRVIFCYHQTKEVA